METTTDRPGPFTGIGTTTEIETGLDEAFSALIPIRDVHDPEILRALAKQLPRHVAVENQAVLLECNQDGNYVVGMSDPLNAVNVRNVVRALGISSSRVRPRLVIAQRLTMLQDIAYEERGDQLLKPEPELHRRDSTRETIDWQSLDSNAATATAQAHSAEPDVEIGEYETELNENEEYDEFDEDEFDEDEEYDELGENEEVPVDEPLESEQMPHVGGEFAPYFSNVTETLMFCWIQKHNICKLQLSNRK